MTELVVFAECDSHPRISVFCGGVAVNIQTALRSVPIRVCNLPFCGRYGGQRRGEQGEWGCAWDMHQRYWRQLVYTKTVQIHITAVGEMLKRFWCTVAILHTAHQKFCTHSRPAVLHKLKILVYTNYCHAFFASQTASKLTPQKSLRTPSRHFFAQSRHKKDAPRCETERVRKNLWQMPYSVPSISLVEEVN